MGNYIKPWSSHRLALGLLLWLAAGCFGSEPDRLWVDRIRVLGEDDGPSLLDIEVHLLDPATREHLGCAVLEPVDVSSRTYEDLRSHFVLDSRRVEPGDLSGRDVVIEVIEDDTRPCPSPPEISAGDDPVGTSGPIAGDGLGSTGPLSFGNVPLLEIGLHP